MLLPWLSLIPVLFCVSADSTDYSTLHMDSVTGVLEDFESQLRGTPDQTVTELFRELECCKGELCQLLLGPVTSAPSDVSYLSEQQSIFLKNLVNHEVDASLVEHGVVLTPDGTTVSLSPLLAGIAVGLQRSHKETLHATPLIANSTNSSVVELPLTLEPLFATTIAMDLGKAFLLFHTNRSQVALGPDGCWDSISAPQKFTLMGAPSTLPDAFINGAMDGLILGTYLAEKADPPSNLSVLLKDYYGGEGLGGESAMQSNFRRKNFAALVSEEKLRMQVEDSLLLLRRLNESNPLFDGLTNEELRSVANQAVEEFTALYVECPAIIPRCMWGARPYRGTPAQLQLPLGFVYIHHTSTPAKPCRSFPSCAADMRSMQRFHQDFRGWDDIGYSYVAGGDGYIYQGRGWHWVGAHTRSYNTKGYGISFIGDYMEALPDAQSMELVKNNFIKCAVRGSKLQANYTIHGHRQMGNTLCPGDRLFKEIQTWKGFAERCFTDKGVRRCI
uniref:Peptidoglycan recognition protein 2 n=1 Tax=Podarcis muralis TaxID=64176 RepID=A0A670KH03_PODMU